MRVLATLVNASRTTASATRRAEVTVSTGRAELHCWGKAKSRLDLRDHLDKGATNGDKDRGCGLGRSADLVMGPCALATLGSLQSNGLRE